jgi:hypothetical protein
MVKRVLLIAFQFPPMSGTNGIQRTLRFAQHLPKFGWEPIVLSANPRAYPVVGDDQLGDIAAGMPVKRAFALDTARHLAIAGKYPIILAMPDRWIRWWLGAVPSGLALLRKYQPQVVWSSPISSVLSLYYVAAMSRCPNVPSYARTRGKHRAKLLGGVLDSVLQLGVPGLQRSVVR